jgi:enoyl-CoA hydratase/carnithine racemase
MNFQTLGFQTLKAESVEKHVLLVTLNRPEVLNAINTQMGRDLLDLWTRLTADPGDTRCIVLTGAGERAFCAGGDLKERDGMTQAQWQAQHELFERGFAALLELPTPVIAAVNGHAYGGGLETALACDFIYAARSARFALSEVRLGIMPGGGGTQNLPRAVGERRAKELILTAKAFTAEEGFDWGLINRISENVVADALQTATAIAENAPLSVRQAKKSIHYGLQMDLLTGYRFEIEAYNRLVDTEDRREGVRAFNEKRKPVFKGK